MMRSPGCQARLLAMEATPDVGLGIITMSSGSPPTNAATRARAASSRPCHSRTMKRIVAASRALRASVWAASAARGAAPNEPWLRCRTSGSRPKVLHLNHGSFGAAPRAALAAQTEARSALEAATMRFMVREWQGRLDAARARVAAFVGGDPEDMVMIPNPTSGVASIANSLAWQPGDRIIVTDHGY